MANTHTIYPIKDKRYAGDLCERVLSDLPAWFGPREIHCVYFDAVEERPVFAASVNGEDVAIMALTRTSDAAVDIHLIAVTPAHHHQGIGRALVARATSFAQDAGAAFLTVKTLGPSHSSPEYDRTRGFYRRMGFAPLEEFADFWGGGVPMLLMCKNMHT